MRRKLVTAPASEPITLQEFLDHVRAESGTLAENTTVSQTIPPGAHVIASAYSLLGAAVDILGSGALVTLEAGTVGTGATVTVKIQHSDNSSTWTDWTGGAFTPVTESNDNATQELEYTGLKRYIRAVATVAGATSAFGVSVIETASYAAESSQICQYISTAREYCEGYSGHAFVPQTWDYLLDGFPACDSIDIPQTPLTAISSIKYKDSTGTETTMTPTTGYLVDVDSQPGAIVLPYGGSWPSFTPYPVNPITIRAVIGYTGTAPYVLPIQYKQAVLIMSGLLYKYRDQGIPKEDMLAVHRLLDRKRMRWF